MVASGLSSDGNWEGLAHMGNKDVEAILIGNHANFFRISRTDLMIIDVK